MRLTQFTDYALRLLMMVDEADGNRVTIEQAATRHRLSRPNLMKVANELTKAGFLTGIRGRSGGLVLARPAAEIHVGDVVQAIEPDFALVECFTTGNECALTGFCRLPPILNESTRIFLDNLNRTTLADLAARRRETTRPGAAALSSAQGSGTGLQISEKSGLTDELIDVTNDDIKEQTERRYDSPLRRSQANDTRERILAALARMLQASWSTDIVFDDLAREAGVERRTVFRHFPGKEQLLSAFWEWVNARTAPAVLPRSLDDLVRLPIEAFAGFDRQEGIIRASLHSPAGRQMRLAALPERQAAFSHAVAQGLGDAAPENRRLFEALAHVLYSASTWETFKDYCGLSGEDAGKAASWALGILAEAARSGKPS